MISKPGCHLCEEAEVVVTRVLAEFETDQASIRVVLDHKNILDDPQLLIYARAANEDSVGAHLQGHQVHHAQWVSLKVDVKRDKKLLRSLELEGVSDLMPQFDEQMTEDVQNLWSRKAMTAFAPDGVCKYCEARGICRKGMW